MIKIKRKLVTKEFVYELENKVEKLAGKFLSKYADQFSKSKYELILTLDRIHSNYGATNTYPMTQDQCLEANYYSSLDLRVKNSKGEFEWIIKKPDYDEDEEAGCFHAIWSTEKRIFLFLLSENCWIGRKHFYMLSLTIEQLEGYLERDIQEYAKRLKIPLK